MKITDEMVEAFRDGWLTTGPRGNTGTRIKSGLEAVAPLIAAQALRHEADNAPGASDVPNGAWCLTRYSRNYLRVRADQLEREADQ